MKPYFRFPKCILLTWRQLRIVAYLLVIFCPRGILMEIWVILFKFTSIYSIKMTSAPVSFFLSIPFLEALTFLLITWFPLALNHTSCPYQRQQTVMQKLLTYLRTDSDLSLGNTTSISFILSPPEPDCQMLLAPWSFPGWGIQVACRIMLPLWDRPCSQPFQRYICCQIQIPHSSYIVSLTGYEWLPRGLSLLISLDRCKLLQKIMKVCWLGQWRFYVISSAGP